MSLRGAPPYMFRHTFASDWLANGGSEGDLMRLARRADQGGWSTSTGRTLRRPAGPGRQAANRRDVVLSENPVGGDSTARRLAGAGKAARRLPRGTRWSRGTLPATRARSASAPTGRLAPHFGLEPLPECCRRPDVRLARGSRPDELAHLLKLCHQDLALNSEFRAGSAPACRVRPAPRPTAAAAPAGSPRSVHASGSVICPLTPPEHTKTVSAPRRLE